MRLFPPIRSPHAARVLVGKQLRPRGAEYPIGTNALNQPLVQLLHQAIALRLVDHESEIQIIGGLSHQVDLVVLKQFKGGTHFMQDAANVLTQET